MKLNSGDAEQNVKIIDPIEIGVCMLGSLRLSWSPLVASC